MTFKACFFTPPTIDACTSPKREKQGVSQRIWPISTRVPTIPASIKTEQGQPAPLLPVRFTRRTFTRGIIFVSAFIVFCVFFCWRLMSFELPIVLHLSDNGENTIPLSTQHANLLRFGSSPVSQCPSLCFFNGIHGFWNFRVVRTNIFLQRFGKAIGVHSFFEQFEHRVNLAFHLNVHIPLRCFPRHIFPYIVHVF